MKTIGFIDYYIDEWHANTYPRMIKESRFKEEFAITLAWKEVTLPGNTPLAEWCRHYGVRQAASVEEVVHECDCLVVLSPDNPERHEELADLPLRSGKPVYLDKPFAPTLGAAQRMFAKARQHGTPLMSASALRFGSELDAAMHERLAGNTVHFVATRGSTDFLTYAIHQLEMLVMTLGVGAQRVMQCGTTDAPLMLIDYGAGRRGMINLLSGHPFQFSASFGEQQSLAIDAMDDFFPRFIDSMLTFFTTGTSSIPVEETLEIIALYETGLQALHTPDCWVPVVCTEEAAWQTS